MVNGHLDGELRSLQCKLYMLDHLIDNSALL